MLMINKNLIVHIVHISFPKAHVFCWNEILVGQAIFIVILIIVVYDSLNPSTKYLLSFFTWSVFFLNLQ